MAEASAATAAAAGADAVGRRTIRAITLRIVPFLMVCFFVSFLDRVNVGFASLQMIHDTGMSYTAFGWGVSAFFVTLCLFEVPSNIAMRRVGARLWLARIMITWGLISGATSLVVGTWSFVTLRLLLGAAEAGFFPGVILYLTQWFPRAHRARVVSLFLIAMPVSNFLGSPLSGWLLGLEGWLGLHGWQWLLVIEALPAIVLGLVCLAWLPDSPAEAGWLRADERAWLHDTLSAERAAVPVEVRTGSTVAVLLHPRVLALALIYAGSVGCNYGLSYWQPQMIKAFGLTNVETGLVNAIPFGIGAVAMVLWARHSDRSAERTWHTALPLFVSGLGLAACLSLSTLAPTVLALTFALTGCYAVKAPMFALTAESLSEAAAPVGIAQVCALGNVAGLVCPLLIGWLRDLTGAFTVGLLPMVALALAAAVTTLRLRSGTRGVDPGGRTLATTRASA